MDIEKLRKEIDATDFEIVRLFEKRMQISKEIGAYKKANDLPLFDKKREDALFKSRVNMLSDKQLKSYLTPLLKTLVELSKSYQFKKNIALIGMMGSGKTSKGKVVANRLGMRFVDIDEKIEKEQKMSVAQLFQTLGETAFRRLESEKIKRYAKRKNYLISTGGGAVLCHESMELLQKNGVTIFLNRDIDIIVNSIDAKNRPLLKDGTQKLYDIYNERLPLYKRWSDIEIRNEHETIDEAADEIISTLFKLAR
ncbi:MAG: chorismate mutase [Firmicutes bacterium]|nr:chorismate mutase [Bacillota bacterium]